MRKYILLVAIVFAFSIVDTFASTKLFSMNIHCLKDNWKQRVSQILDKAIEKDSDFINLQEICIYKDENMHNFIMNYLHSKTGTYWYSNTHFMHLAWDKYDEYIGLYSKQRPQATQSGFLPASPLQRAYTAMKIEDVWFVGVHLEHSNEWGHYRTPQIDFLINMFGNEKTVLMGDFNSGYDWPEQNKLHSFNWRSFFPGLTYPSQKPYKGIDGFWLSPKLKSNIKEVSMLLDTPVQLNNTQMYLSDHFGVFLDFNTL